MHTTGTVLLIEDHRDIAEMIASYLEGRGFVVDYAADGVTGLHLATTKPVDLIVLDLSLPGIDGLDICRAIREQAKLDTPIIMLTARDTLDEKIAGLNAGADDYLVKPFAIRELAARVNAQLRRNRSEVTREKLVVGDLVLDKSTLQVQREGRDIRLPPTGLRLLEVLMRSSPAVMSRAELERKVWGDVLPDSDTLRSHMYSLRKKVDKPFSRSMILNHPGSGYQLVVCDEQ
ncbi:MULTISPECIES: response regulator transcription factor [Microbulbifer]|uniref:Response regulator transcription factor n=1 Tax=Microbulbifer salipaludis TaxID=187980 RepID=A0ABS3E2P3_9GAMM|nr:MULTISPECIES: response regulator transcription factor [Microbulbifer]MBN8429563.1 response regulator transcription factor [Microbulbifer salipaludis]